jgi:hypothetical protein
LFMFPAEAQQYSHIPAAKSSVVRRLYSFGEHAGDCVLVLLEACKNILGLFVAAVAALCVCRFVELDRCAAAAEAGYAVGLFKVLGADSMAKNDLLVGLPYAATTPATAPPAAAAAAAAAATASHAAVQSAAEGSGSATASRGDAVLAGLLACSKQLVDRGLLFTAAMLGAQP